MTAGTDQKRRVMCDGTRRTPLNAIVTILSLEHELHSLIYISTTVAT